MVLKKGTKVYGGVPGQSPFYTSEEALRLGGGSRKATFEGLQAKANPKYGHRPALRIYEVTEDIHAAQSVAKANPQHGAGGITQFFIENYDAVLKPVTDVPLGM